MSLIPWKKSIQGNEKIMKEKAKVAFQGELGAYSHIACEALFPGAEIKTCPTFEETFKISFSSKFLRKVFGLKISGSKMFPTTTFI